MEYEVKPLAGNQYIVTTPELIKVRTIKKKYLDDVPTYNPTVEETLLDKRIDFLGGPVDGHYVFTMKQKVWKIHQGDLLRHLTNELRDHYGTDTHKRVQRILGGIPQLFKD